MMTISRLCCVVVTALAMGAIGCGELDGAAPVSQLDEEVTQCQLNCPSGAVLTCTTAPCSITSNTMTCNGVTTTCPSCVPTTCAAAGAECGTIADGCGGTLNCGGCGANQQCISNFCEVSCPSGKIDCCGDGVCRSALLCFKIGC